MVMGCFFSKSKSSAVKTLNDVNETLTSVLPVTVSSAEPVEAQAVEFVRPFLLQKVSPSSEVMKLKNVPENINYDRMKSTVAGVHTEEYRRYTYSSTGPLHENEDRHTFFVLKNPMGSLYGNVACFGVFDGHGGHNCAQYLATHLESYMEESYAWKAEGLELPEKLQLAVEESLERAEEDYCELSLEDGDRSGACIIFGVMCDGYVCVANVGDALGIIHFPGKDGKMGQWMELSRAHRCSEESEMKRIEAAGGIVVNNRAFGVLAPSRSIGDVEIKRVCIGAVSAIPHVSNCLVEDGHTSVTPATSKTGAGEAHVIPFIVIASDGLWDFVEMGAVVKQTEAILRKNHGKKKLTSSDNPARHIVRSAIRAGTLDDTTAQ